MRAAADSRHYAASYDNAAVARQLGLLPASGSRGERLFVAAQRLGARLPRRGGEAREGYDVVLE